MGFAEFKERYWTDENKDNVKTTWSAALTVFGMVVMTAATIDNKNLFWPSVPPYVQIPFLVVDILLLGTLEGIQISLVALKNHNSEAFKDSHPRAYKTNALAQKGRNLERFLMGRQVFVVITVFFGAYITTQSDEFRKLLGWVFPTWIGSAFFQTGLMGVLVVAIFGQLMPQVVASAYPINFMQVIPFVYPVMVGCLFFEDMGFVYLCYTVADVFMHVTGLKKPSDHSEVHLKKRGFSKIFRTRGNFLTRLRSKSSSRAVQQSGDNNNNEQLSSKLGQVLDTLQASSPADDEIVREAMRKYPHLFNNFPSVVGGRVYASPQQVFQHMEDQGFVGKIPGYLAPAGTDSHLPPHIYACQLLAQQYELKGLLGEQAKDTIAALEPFKTGVEDNDDLLKAMTNVRQ